MRTVAAVVAAAGRGERLGAGEEKALVSLAERPLLEWTLDALAAVPEIVEVVVVLGEEGLRRMGERPRGDLSRWRVAALVRGGPERFDSVRVGLRALGRPTDLVLVHDAARPLVRPERVREAIQAASACGGAVLAVPCADTLKRVGGATTIQETVPREALWRAHTPQVFRRDPFLAAVESASRDGFRPTDDAAVAERAGIEVRVVPDDPTNIKVTTREDLALAEAILDRRGRASR